MNVFKKMEISTFEHWLDGLGLERRVTHVQQHHTWSPDYGSFDGHNHLALQRAMRDYHVGHNGWSEIGQHFTTFPDGSIVTGRGLERNPACILGHNAGGICIENLGNFDLGGDLMTVAQRETVIRSTAALVRRFGLQVNVEQIVYHHWFDLSSGGRNNGMGNNKSCPGSGFFGGNGVAACETGFLPLVREALKGRDIDSASLLGRVMVLAARLDIRKGPGLAHGLAGSPAVLGSIMPIYGTRDGWYLVSPDGSMWVRAALTQRVERYTVSARSLNVRSGPGLGHGKKAALQQGQEVFVAEYRGNWCRIGADQSWVCIDYLSRG